MLDFGNTLDDEKIKIFADKIRGIGALRLDIIGEEIELINSRTYSINNQGGELQELNFLGRDLEYEFLYKGERQFVAVQLYLNEANHYRIFVMGKGNKMWTSVNLSMGLVDRRIEFDIQIKVSAPQSDSKEQRAARRDAIVEALKECGLVADKKNHISFGAYDLEKEEFINITPEKFIKNLLTIGICKEFI